MSDSKCISRYGWYAIRLSIFASGCTRIDSITPAISFVRATIRGYLFLSTSMRVFFFSLSKGITMSSMRRMRDTEEINRSIIL